MKRLVVFLFGIIVTCSCFNFFEHCVLATSVLGPHSPYDQGFQMGFENAYRHGYDDAKAGKPQSPPEMRSVTSDYDRGVNEGHQKGYAEGYAKGGSIRASDPYHDAYKEGYKKGFALGFSDGKRGNSDANPQVSDSSQIMDDSARGLMDGKAKGYSNGYDVGSGKVVLPTNQNATDAAPINTDDDWIDATTGHRVVRLSRIEGENVSFYYHINSYTQSGDLMVFANSQPDANRRLYAVNLKTFVSQAVTDQDSENMNEIVGARRRSVFYKGKSDGNVYVTHLDTRKTKKICELPKGWQMMAINADETLLAGCFAEGANEMKKGLSKKDWVTKIYEAKLPNLLFTIEIDTGKVNVIYRANEWLDHVQFSPTDSNLMSFVHQGPWEKVDMIWQIRTDGSDLKQIHKRTMANEIYGHEFWSPDGRWIWYDLQMPIRENYFIGGTDISTGQETRYPIAKGQASVHFNISHKGTMFAGDGSPRGRWIYLFTPKDGKLQVEKLCNLKDHDYKLEPCVTFTPNDKWVVFRSNMKGSNQVYAVQVLKGSGSGTQILSDDWSKNYQNGFLQGYNDGCGGKAYNIPTAGSVSDDYKEGYQAGYLEAKDDKA